MRLIVLTLMICILAIQANAATYLNGKVHSSAGVNSAIDSLTVAQLPAAGTAGRLRQVTDGSSGTDCSLGGGASVVVCQDTGSAWAAISSTGSGDLLADGTVPLTADWDVGSHEIRAETFESDVPTGTAPLVVASTTKVTNLNCDALDNQTGSYYQTQDALLDDIAAFAGLGTGDIVYYDGANFAILSAGTQYYILQANGAAPPSWTSTVNISAIDLGAGDLEIPNSADPTVDTLGQVAVDSSDDQLTYYGAAQRTIRYEEEVCVTMEDLAAADDGYTFMSFRDAVTITGAWCHYRGTGSTPATIDLQDGAGNAMTMTDATCAASTTTATPQAVTAGNVLTAYEMLAFNVTNAVSPETDEYTICVSYVVNEQ